MGRLIISESMTLDGVMQSPGFDGEDTEGGFRYGGWIAPYFDDYANSQAVKDLENAGAFLIGKKTYDIWAKFWPAAPAEEADVAKLMNGMRKYVVSDAAFEPEWENSILVTGDLVKEIAKIKEETQKNVLVGGSGQLIPLLMQSGLVDEYQLTVPPLVLGSGKRLFRDDVPMQKLELIEHTVNSTGMLFLRYKPVK